MNARINQCDGINDGLDPCFDLGFDDVHGSYHDADTDFDLETWN